MGLLTEDYDKQGGVFDFIPTEPPVFKLTDYLTPRGAHIFISQAGYCLLENLFREEEFDMSVEEYRNLFMCGRLKIVELNQKYRRELKTDRTLQGRMNLTNIRWGRMPIIKIDFDIANRAIMGNFTGVLAPKPMIQMNADIMR